MFKILNVETYDFMFFMIFYEFIQFFFHYIKEFLQKSCGGKIVLEQYKKKNFNNSVRNDLASLVIKAKFADDPDKMYDFTPS